MLLGSRVALIAPQAYESSWCPGSFAAPISENDKKGHFTSTLAVINECISFASRHVPTNRIILFGFSQGACVALTYCAMPKSPSLGGVIGLSGGLFGTDDDAESTEMYPLLHIRGTDIILGCAEEDSHVPRSRVEASAQRFRNSGARVTCDIFPGSEHKIFESSKAKVRSFFSQFVASRVGSSSHDDFEYLSGY